MQRGAGPLLHLAGREEVIQMRMGVDDADYLQTMGLQPRHDEFWVATRSTTMALLSGSPMMVQLHQGPTGKVSRISVVWVAAMTSSIAVSLRRRRGEQIAACTGGRQSCAPPTTAEQFSGPMESLKGMRIRRTPTEGTDRYA